MSEVSWVKELSEGHSALYFFEECKQVVTLRCPKCHQIFISTDMPGCDLCDFKWGDEI